METKELTPEKSLQLISEMIEKSRRDFEKNSGAPMILWGTVVTAVSVAVWYMMNATGNPYWNYLWFAIPFAGYPLSYLLIGKKEEKRAKTFMNEAIGNVWSVFGGISTLLALASCFIYSDAIPLLMPVITACLGSATSVTGALLKNWYVAVCGIIAGVAGCMLSAALTPEYIPLLLGGASVVALIFPGIMINIRRK